MIDWWNSLTAIEQIFGIIAIPSTILLLLQTIFLLFSSFGGDAGSDGHEGDMHDLDMSHDAGHDFSLEHDVNGHDGDDADELHDEHGLQDSGLRIFTVRGFIAFFCVFGWSGLVFLRNGMNPSISIFISVALGFASMALMAYVFSLFIKLQVDGTADIQSAVGVSGSVYITIPASREGVGKVSAIVSGRYSEYEAVTDDEQPIKTGMPVSVIGVTGQNILVVIKK